MRWLPLSAVLLAGLAPGAETSSPVMREKLRARIVETLPPAAAATSAGPRAEPAGEPMFVLEPMVVTESKGVRELAKALAEDKQRQAAESFSVLKGGRIYGGERLELGGWWAPATGWQFFRLKW